MTAEAHQRLAVSSKTVGQALIWLSLLLALGGLGIASYLTFVHYQGIPLVCEGSGGCHTVQSSEYATLLGVPVATLGAGLYMGIIIGNLATLLTRGGIAEFAPFLVFGLAFSGVLFSGYLTWLELYRIHAICVWCVASACLLAAILISAVSHLIVTGTWREEFME